MRMMNAPGRKSSGTILALFLALFLAAGCAFMKTAEQRCVGTSIDKSAKDPVADREAVEKECARVYGPESKYVAPKGTWAPQFWVHNLLKILNDLIPSFLYFTR